jgi:hypothetical protein
MLAIFIAALIISFPFIRGQESPKVSEYPSPIRELVDLSKHKPYEYQGIGVKLERAIMAVYKLDDSPDRTKSVEMIIQALLRNEIDKIWFDRVVLSYVLPSYIELLESKDEKVRQFVQEELPQVLRPSSGQQQQFRHFLTGYLTQLRQQGKAEPARLVDLLFDSNPEFTLEVFWSLSKEFSQLPEEQKRQHAQEMEWLVHCVDVAYYRSRYLKQADPEDIKPARQQLKWLLWNYPQWWAGRYVVEVLIRTPELASEELLEELHKQSHPYVTKRLPELEKKLRRTP